MNNNFPKNSHHLITINSINSNGDGVGRIDGWVVFVPYSVPGDELEIKITETKRNYSAAEIFKIVKPSSFRVEALCRYFGECGGCSIQTIDYKYQLKLKNELLKENLKKIGNIKPELVKETIPSSKIWNYRNKVQHVVSKKEKLKFGFFQKNSHNVVDIDECPIQNDLSNKLVKQIKSIILSLNWSIYSEKSKKGLLRHVILKSSFSKNEILCILVTTKEELPLIDQFIEYLMPFKEVVGIVQNVNSASNNTILGFKNIVLYGRDYIIEEIGNLNFNISTSSFFQVNTDQLENIYKLITNLTAPLGYLDYVIDAYCGIGTFSLYMSNKAKYICGIEENQEAIERAKENGKINNISNVNFIAGKVEDLIDKSTENKTCDLIILDPPRKGCERSVLDAIIKSKIKNIIYISCNPSTFARDAGILTEESYAIQEIYSFDMFPHTSHIETAGYFKII